MKSAPFAKEKMMKKIIGIVICVLLLAGCGNKIGEKPDDISEEAYEDAILAVNTIDSYKDNDVDLDQALDSIYEIDLDSDLLFDQEYYNSLSRNENNDLIDNNANYPRDVEIYYTILDIKTGLSTLRLELEDEEKDEITQTIMDFRDDLVNTVNYKN